MDSESSRFAPLARRARTIAVGLAVATLGLAFTACNDEAQKKLEEETKGGY